MRNRFNSREVLCDGINFNPVVGSGSINPSTNVTSAKGITPTPGAEGMSSIKGIMNSLLTGEGLQASSQILRSLNYQP
jgi:hypothetical protein